MARETIASMAVRLGVDLSDFQKDMQEFQKTWGKLGKQLQDAGTKIGVSFTAAGGAIAAGLGLAVNKAMDFDAQISRVGAIADATGSDLDALRQSALELGASTSKSASEVAKGQESLAALGFTVNDIIGAMPGVISAAEASGADMAQTAEVMASTLNIFGKSASDATKVADILAQTANVSAADITDMQYALKYAGPPAASLGVSLEELSAAIGIMTNAGMEGEQAGTSLRGALLGLLSPSEANSKLMDKMGVQVTDAQGNFVGLAKLVENLQDSMAGLTDTQKAATLSNLVGKEAVSGMLSLMAAGPDEINKFTQSLEDSGGASAKAATAMKDNLAGSMDQLQGAVETLQISMGSALAPAIRAIADGLSGMVNWFNQLSPQTQKFIAIGAALTAGLLVMVGAVGFLVAALGFLAAAEWAVILPIAGIIAAVVAVIAILAVLAVMIYNNWDTIKAYTVKAWGAIVDALTAAWDWIVGIFDGVWDKIGPIVTAGWKIISAYFKAAYETWKTILTTAWDVIKTIFTTAFLALYYVVTGQWGKIGALFSAAGEKLKAILSGAWEKIKGIWSNAFETIKSAAVSGWESVKGTFTDTWDSIRAFFRGLPSEMYNFGKDMLQGMVNGIKSMASSVVDAVKNTASSAVDSAKDFLGIHSPSRLFMELGGYTGEGFAIGLEDSASMVAGASENMVASAVPGIDASAASGTTNNISYDGVFNGAIINIKSEDDIRAIARELYTLQRQETRGAGMR